MSRREILRQSWARFIEVVPDLRRPWCAGLVAGGAVLVCGLCLLLGAMAARAAPYGAVLMQGVFVLWAGLGYGCFWRQRAAYLERYGTLAYRHLFFRFLLPGAAAGAGAALYFPLLVAGHRLLPGVVAYGLAAYLLVTSALIEARGKQIFWDIEWRSFVYNVFPERGLVVTAGIFGWLRHPLYSAAIRFTFALALLRNNWSAALCAAIASLAIRCLGTVEERDLMRRDDRYTSYQRRVPAFFVGRHPRRFWQFLLTGDETEAGSAA